MNWKVAIFSFIPLMLCHTMTSQRGLKLLK